MGKLSDAFRNLLGLNKRTYGTTQQQDIQTWNYSALGQNAFELDTVCSSIDAIARNVAKMEFKHVVKTSDGQKKVVNNSDIARVLKNPNGYMTQRDFIYKVTALYYLYNNAFIYPDFDNKGNLIALYPINARSYKIYEYNGNVFISFQIKYTRSYTVPLDEVICLRRFYCNNDFTGDDNKALLPACEVINAQNQGIIGGIKNSAIIRGILKAAQVIKDSDLKADKERFIRDNLDVSNSGGVMIIDSRYDYTPLNQQSYSIDPNAMNVAKAKIFEYFGVNEAFVNNSFTPEQYDAIYEGLLEPFAVMFSQALSQLLFTELERGRGNDIEVSMKRLKYQSIDKITALIAATNQLGVFTPNEYREMLGYTPMEDGDERLISLNYVKASNLDNYQGEGEENNG